MERKEYVSLETAISLKKKGFNEECFSSYDEKGNVFVDKYPKNYNKISFAYSMPHLYDAQKWLREKHDIHISTDWGMDGYDFATTRKDEDGLFIEESYHEYFNTYEECLDNAIRKSLDYVYYAEATERYID